MKRIIISLLILLIILPVLATAKSKIRIAVVEFNDNAVGSPWQRWRLGLAAQDAMVTALVETEKFSVIERQKLDQIMKEQGIGQSGAVTPQTAAKVGKLLGVQYIVTGSITEFGKTDTGGAIAGLVGARVEQYHTALDVRLVNTSTGEILLVAKGEGTATAGGGRIKGVSLGTHGSYGEQAGNVMREAVEEIAEQISDKVEGLGEEMASSVKVALIKDGKVYINAGSNYGISVGDQYTVIEEGEAIIDPDTGLELDREEKEIGTIEVVEVKDKLSICKIISGTANKGDIARKK